MTPQERQRALQAALADLWTDAREEHAVLSLLAQTPDNELDALLGAVSLEALTRSVDDHLLGAKNRTALLSSLTVHRLHALSPDVRAALIMALQSGHTGAVAEQGLSNILLGTRDDALILLKDRLDHQPTYHNLHRLLYTDLDTPALRDAVLAHFAAQGRPTGGIKVLSDIDDTLYANWKDDRYPKGTVYPGVRAFYAELAAQGRLPGSVVFLTARPGDRVGLVERASLESVRGRGLERVTVLPGQWDHLLSHTAIAEGKYGDFLSFEKLYPEYDLVWVGDSGQGDALLARRLMQQHRDRVRGTFIHDVVDTPAGERADWQAEGVFFFETYVGAAVAAARLGLLDRAAVDRVHNVAERELAEVDFPSRAPRVALETAMAAERARLD